MDSNSQKHRMVFVHVFSGGYWSWRNWEHLMYYNYNWHFVETLKEIIPQLLLYEIWGDFDHMELGALDVLYLQLAFCWNVKRNYPTVATICNLWSLNASTGEVTNNAYMASNSQKHSMVFVHVFSGN